MERSGGKEEETMKGYEKNVKLWKKAYGEILDVLEKYKDFDGKYSFYDVEKMIGEAKNHLMLIEWYEKYGLTITHDKRLYGYNYVKLNDHITASYYRDAEAEKNSGHGGKYISWSDDGRQPKDEWLLVISFPTGAYIFGDDYPVNIFQDFWNELKTYNPKYCDSHNNSLYFSLEKAKKVYDNFNDLLNKYQEINQKDFQRRKIEKMKTEIEEFEKKKKSIN